MVPASCPATWHLGECQRSAKRKARSNSRIALVKQPTIERACAHGYYVSGPSACVMPLITFASGVNFTTNPLRCCWGISRLVITWLRHPRKPALRLGTKAEFKASCACRAWITKLLHTVSDSVVEAYTCPWMEYRVRWEKCVRELCVRQRSTC